MIERLNQQVDQWLRVEQFESARERHRVRLTAYTLLGTAVILLLFGVGNLLYAPPWTTTFWVMLLFNMPMVLFAVVMLFGLRHGLSSAWAVNALLGMGWLGIVMTIAITGGPYYAPASFALIVPPVIAFKLTGVRSGTFWALMAVLSEAALVAGDHYGVNYRTFSGEMSPTGQMVQLWVYVFAMVVGFSLFHAKTTENLQRELELERQRFKHMALHDPLTELANRNLFSSALQRALHRCQRYGDSLALLFIDLDNFKQLNDHYCHEAGDEVLRQVAKRLKRVTRASDIVGRLGGDEFAVILQQLAPGEDLQPVIENIYRTLTATVSWHQTELEVDVSIGVSLAPSQAQTATALQMLADRAMYRSKRDGVPWVLASKEDAVPPAV